MASSMLISDLVTSNTDRSRDSSKRKKKKKIQRQSGGGGRDPINQSVNNSNDQTTPWKSEAQQQVYSSKLLQALRQVRVGSGTAPRRGRAVREAADRVLAATAKGRTRWSRAILTNKLKLKFMKSSRRQRGAVATATANSRLKKPRVSILRLKTKNLPAVQRKGRALGRLVPGCRKQSLPVVLEEATDYIAALEMQVKAMAALADLLSVGSSSSSAAVNLSLSQPPPRM